MGVREVKVWNENRKILLKFKVALLVLSFYREREKIMNISVENLKKILIEILVNNGATEEDANIVTEEIVFGQIRGKKSHGLPMLPSMIKRVQKKSDKIKILKESKQFAFIDGCDGIGPVVAKKAMELSIKKTLEHGFSIVAVRNPSPFITAGFPVWSAAYRHKLIALDMSVAKSKVAPYGSSEAIFGTNPIGFAFPTKDYPIVIDMSTTNIAAAKIKQAAECDEMIPQNVALDCEGNPTTDPHKALKGALITFGGYKGSAVALIVELMAGAFLNEKCGKQNGDMRTMLFLTFKPDLCADAEKVFENASNLREEINKSKAVQLDAPRTPGDNAERLMRDAYMNGIELSEQELLLLRKFGTLL